MNIANEEKPKWEIISIYSTGQAIEDGVLVEIDKKLCKEKGISFPVVVTRAVYEKYIVVPVGMEDIQDEIGRTCDILIMLRQSIIEMITNTVNEPERVTFSFLVAVKDAGNWEKHEKRVPNMPEHRFVTLIAAFDNITPQFTIMMPNED